MSSFAVYLGKRLGFMTLSLFAISVIVFVLTQVLPGNAANTLLGSYATDENIATIERQLGLNEPLYVQYLIWVQELLFNAGGESYIHNAPVFDEVIPRLLRSLALAVVTTMITVFVGIPLGVLAAQYVKTRSSSILNGITYLGASVPEMVSGTVLILLFAGPTFSLFPSGGYSPIGEGFLAWLHHLALPAISLSLVLTAHVMRQTRSSMIDTLRSEYIRTARLKGLSERTVLFKHALRNGLLPTITVLALNMGWLIGSIVVVEEVFTYPGIGRLAVRAIQERDLPLIQASVLVISFMYIVANFAADMLYTRLDPQIEYGGK